MKSKTRQKPAKRWRYSRRDMAVYFDGNWIFTCYYAHCLAGTLVRALNRYGVVIPKARKK